MFISIYSKGFSMIKAKDLRPLYADLVDAVSFFRTDPINTYVRFLFEGLPQ